MGHTVYRSAKVDTLYSRQRCPHCGCVEYSLINEEQIQYTKMKKKTYSCDSCTKTWVWTD